MPGCAIRPDKQKGDKRTGTQPAVNTYSQENRAKPTQQPGT